MPDFSLRPDELRSTSKDLADVSSRMKGVMSRLTTALTVEGEPWGDDDSGRKFRHGDHDNGYDDQREWVVGSVDAKVRLLEEYAKGLRSTADNLENLDDV